MKVRFFQARFFISCFCTIFDAEKLEHIANYRLRMRKVTFFFGLVFFHCLFLSGQTTEQLLQDLKYSSDNTQKVDLLIEIANSYLNTNVKKSQNYSEDAIKLATKLSYEAGKNEALLMLGKANFQRGRYSEAAERWEAALPWAEQNKNMQELLNLYQQLAQVYQLLKEPAKKEVYRQKYHILEERQANQAKFQEKEKTIQALGEEVSTQRDSAYRARLEAIRAQVKTDSALHLVSEQQMKLILQSLEVDSLAREAERIEREKLQSELALERQKQQLAQERQRFYWIIAAFVLVLVIGLGAWFYYQSRQARKLAKMEHQEAERLRILTAGIAHEIKNPLNFVNNFAEGSVEIVEELEEALHENGTPFQSEQLSLITELVGELKQNSIDIQKNGKRVHQIVQSMNSYASGGKGERKATNLNELLDENINLAYHGYRAQHPDFIANIERKYDTSLHSVELVPQDVGRVLLNIVNNACFALHQKQRALNGNFTPTLKVMTASQYGEAIVRIRDNGTGIPKEVVDKIFTPFFTTKPTGTGNTGLGLSISREIIVQNHKGKLEVETNPGEFTEFIIRLPKS